MKVNLAAQVSANYTHLLVHVFILILHNVHNIIHITYAGPKRKCCKRYGVLSRREDFGNSLIVKTMMSY